jgi:hypothetical protein
LRQPTRAAFELEMDEYIIVMMMAPRADDDDDDVDAE